MKKKKSKKQPAVIQLVKIVRKANREEEIRAHGKPVRYGKIAESKKKYDRKKNKTVSDDELSYF
ncbi:MAG: hypothetical protein LBS07_01985 [Prevotellaceae bacterium]|nr:hypothetical protein [Prevotellaceae bacterium]